MVMMRQLQTNLNRFIDRFHDRWETEPSFRATWSMIGGAFAIVFVISSLLISLNVANSLTGGGNKPLVDATVNPLYSGGNGLQPTYIVGQATSNTTPTPGANPIATSNAPTPVPTASPTPSAATPSATATTGTPGAGTATPSATLPANETVTAVQQPSGGWTAQYQNQNQIANIATSPAVQNGQIAFTIDFMCGGQNGQVTVSGTLQGDGTLPNLGQSVTIPSCYKASSQQAVKVTVTIDGLPVQFTPTFTAKGQ